MKGGEVTRDLPLCSCGERPVLIWHYIKGRANTTAYFVKCEYCHKRTQNRKRGNDAVKEWEDKITKQTNLEWLRSLHPDETVEKFERKCSDLRHDYNPYDAAISVLEWLSLEHVEPIILTEEERKAVELAIEIGLPWIKRTDNFVFIMDRLAHYGQYKGVAVEQVPALEPLRFMLAIENGAEPIDLRTLI